MRNNIKELRAERDMTQEELAKTAGISRTVLSQLENETRTVITSETMLKLSKALDTPTEDIFILE